MVIQPTADDSIKSGLNKTDVAISRASSFPKNVNPIAFLSFPDFLFYFALFI